MKNILAILAIAISGASLFVNGYLFSQISNLKQTIDSLKENSAEVKQDVAKLETSLTKTNQELVTQATILENTAQQSRISTTAESASSSANVNQVQDNNQEVASRKIEPGEFVSTGYENQVEFELLSAKRITNPKTNQKDVVNVRLRVRRIVPKVNNALIAFSQAKGRDPETSEDYRTITNKTTTYTSANNLPENAWANAYFWLKVPENVEIIDIAIPKTAMFKEVPIAND
ncbi:MAG: hypothetical protein AAF298_28420 [Cyanobacteria bacterium P01_A01_bin.40]